MVNWEVVLGDLATQVLRIILPVGIALILKWAGELWLKLKAQTPEVAELLSYAVSIAVRAAEQEFGGKHGEEKKQYAIDFVQKFLSENNITMDVSVIASAIEASVFSANQYSFGHGDDATDNAE